MVVCLQRAEQLRWQSLESLNRSRPDSIECLEIVEAEKRRRADCRHTEATIWPSGLRVQGRGTSRSRTFLSLHG